MIDKKELYNGLYVDFTASLLYFLIPKNIKDAYGIYKVNSKYTCLDNYFNSLNKKENIKEEIELDTQKLKTVSYSELVDTVKIKTPIKEEITNEEKNNIEDISIFDIDKIG